MPGTHALSSMFQGCVTAAEKAQIVTTTTIAVSTVMIAAAIVVATIAFSYAMLANRRLKAIKNSLPPGWKV